MAEQTQTRTVITGDHLAESREVAHAAMSMLGVVGEHPDERTRILILTSVQILGDSGWYRDFNRIGARALVEVGFFVSERVDDQVLLDKCARLAATASVGLVD